MSEMRLAGFEHRLSTIEKDLAAMELRLSAVVENINLLRGDAQRLAAEANKSGTVKRAA